MLRVDGAAATPSRSPNGYEIGHGMGKTWGSVGSAYEGGGEHAGSGYGGEEVARQGVWGSRRGFGEACAGWSGGGRGGWEGE